MSEKIDAYPGDSSPPLQAHMSAGSAPAQASPRAAATALKKHISFTGLTVELFEDVEEV